MRFHIASNLLYLRRHRKLSQSAVAAAVGTSQSAIARIESAQENITLDTLERILVVLKGRFQVSIAPEEFTSAPATLWWEAGESERPWNVVTVMGRRSAEVEQVIVGLERKGSEMTEDGTHPLFVGAQTLLEGSTDWSKDF